MEPFQVQQEKGLCSFPAGRRGCRRLKWERKKKFSSSSLLTSRVTHICKSSDGDLRRRKRVLLLKKKLRWNFAPASRSSFARQNPDNGENKNKETPG